MVRALLIFSLKNLLVVLTNPLVVFTAPLVVFVAWCLSFLFRQELSQLVRLFSWLCMYQYESITKVVDSLNYFDAQSPNFPS